MINNYTCPHLNIHYVWGDFEISECNLVAQYLQTSCLCCRRDLFLCSPVIELFVSYSGGSFTLQWYVGKQLSINQGKDHFGVLFTRRSTAVFIISFIYYFGKV